MTGILSNNIVRGAIALVVVGAVIYGVNTTGGDTETTVSTTTGENVTTTASETTPMTEEGTTTEAIEVTTEETTTETTTE